MRKLALCGLVVITCATVAAVAMAANQATTFSLKHGTRAEGVSTSVKFKISFGDPDAPNGVPDGLQSFKIKLHKGTKIDGRGAVKCNVTAAELMAEGQAACPAASNIGSATATATAANGASIPARAVIFNEVVEGRDAFLFLFVNDDGSYVTAFDAPIKGGTISSSELTGALPGALVVTKFNGTIEKHSKGRGKRRRHLITSPKVCPKRTKKWKNSATFVFQDDSKDTVSSTSACKP